VPENNKIFFVSTDLEGVITSKMVSLGGGMWQCTDCELKTKRTNLYNHIESKHVGDTAGHICGICGSFCKSKQALVMHKSRYHRKGALVNTFEF